MQNMKMMCIHMRFADRSLREQFSVLLIAVTFFVQSKPTREYTTKFKATFLIIYAEIDF